MAHPVLLGFGVVMAVVAVVIAVWVYGAAIIAVAGATWDVLVRAFHRLFPSRKPPEPAGTVLDMDEHYDPLKDEALLRQAEAAEAEAWDDAYDDDFDPDAEGEFDEFGEFHDYDDVDDPYWDEVYGSVDDVFEDFSEGEPDDDDDDLPDNVIRFPKRR